MKLLVLLGALGALTTPALAADLIVQPESFAVDEVAYDWSGPYVGLNVGAAFGLTQATLADEDEVWLLDDSGTFPFIGVQVGYNFHLQNNMVVGIEADLQSGLSNDAGVDTWSADVDLWGTLRGRLGVAVDRTLIYATGGLAWGHTNFDDAWWLPADFSTDDARFGYAIGAGIEQAVTDTVSVKAEYLFVNLGAVGDTAPFADGDFDGDVAFHAIRAGVNFKF